MNEGNPAAPRAHAGLGVDQPVAAGTALREGQVEIGDAVADMVDARPAPSQESRDGPVGSARLEQLDLGLAEGQGNDAGSVGFFRRVWFDAEHVAVEWQRGFDALDRDAHMGDGRAFDDGGLGVRHARILTEREMSDSKNTVAVTDESFAGVVEKGVGLVVVDFWAAWCGPCRAIAPHLEALAEQFQGKATVAKLDVDAHPRTPMRFNVRSIPTLLFFKNGKHVDTVVGLANRQALEAKFQQHI